LSRTRTQFPKRASEVTARIYTASCAPKKAADNEVLCNPNAPPSQAESRPPKTTRTSKTIYLPSLFVVLTGSSRGAERGYFGFYTETLPVFLTRKRLLDSPGCRAANGKRVASHVKGKRTITFTLSAHMHTACYICQLHQATNLYQQSTQHNQTISTFCYPNRIQPWT
jgi:hypothetical protein